MEIEKNGKIYTVTENKKSWTITSKTEKIEVSYKVQKEDFVTFGDVEAFVKNDSMF